MTIDAAAASEPTARLDWGVTVAGFLRGGLGLGEAARLYVAALAAAGVPIRTRVVDVDLPTVLAPSGRPAVKKVAEFADLDTDRPCPINLICVNAPELPRFYREVGEGFFAGKQSIGVWGWEVDKVPDEWSWSFELVDEIWVYSTYVAEIVGKHATVPVVCVPLPISRPQRGEAAPDLGLPERFTFLYLFDFFSTVERKNPIGLIDAFKRAFRPGEGPQLVLKSFNGDYKPQALARVEAAADHPDVHVVDRYVTVAQKNAMIERCDCYVSLHRAEGFGLTIAEAMALKRPVIATNFSGNVDFMTAANSYPVDYTLTEVGASGENYPADGCWAEPDLDHAAAMMREVWSDRDGAAARAALGASDVAETLSIERVGSLARARLERMDQLGGRTGRALGVPRPVPAPPPAAVYGPVRAAIGKLAFDPQRYARETGGLRGLARLGVLKVLRPFAYHQDELNRAVVEALREGHDRLEGVLREAALDSRGRSDLRLIIDGFRARPGFGHPALWEVDERGRPALGFSEEGEAGHGYRGFEDIFRGNEELIRARQEQYVELLSDADWVLDVGCGRGEFLELLRKWEIAGRGVDLDEEMVERCREKDLDVERVDALEYLSGREDDSIPAVMAAQVIEHLSPEVFKRLLSLVEAKLEPGGVAILETMNPHCPRSLKAFWTDPTHHHPLFPEVVLALCRSAGFAAGRILFDEATGGTLETQVYSSPDYAVIATKRKMSSRRP